MGEPHRRRLRCEDCGRPILACWCAFVKPTSSRHRIIVLQHPKEAREPFGTARVLCRVLPQVQLITGVSFSHEVAAETLRDPDRPPVLLFPVRDAEVLRPIGDGSARTLLLLDGTWTQARQMWATNRWLQQLPTWRLELDRPSVYTVRQAPGPNRFCTVETIAEALAIVDGAAASRDALIAPLRAMVGLQQAAEDAGSSSVLTDRGQLSRAGYLPGAR